MYDTTDCFKYCSRYNFTKLNGNSKVVCTAIRTTLGNKRYFCPNNNTENY